MSQSLATLSHHHQGLYRRPLNSSQPYLFQHEYERFLLSTENVLAAAATVKGNHHELLDDFAEHEALEYRTTSSSSQGEEVPEHQINTHGPRTVEDIEKWLKNVNEPVLSTKLGKNVNSRESMERYLSEHLPEIFFDKDFMTTENNLDNKKLTVNYDAVFDDIQNEKLIATHDKDDVFILPDLQLDNLDQLAYCTDDMILTNDILPIPCDEPPCTNINVDNKDFIIRLQETINLLSSSNNTELTDNNLDDNVMELENNTQEDFCNNSITTSTKDLCTNNNVSSNKSSIDDSSDCSDLANNEDLYTIESHSLTLQPSDPTRPTRLHIKFKRVHADEKNSIQQKNERLDKIYTRSRKKLVSADDSLIGKQSKNSTIKDENSKSIKKLKKKSSNNDFQKSKQDDHLKVRPLSSYNYQEAISKALKGVGITNDKLHYFKSKDNIKIWQCHQDNCNRNFNKLSFLRIHMLTHFGIKPFKCDHNDCSSAFYSNDKLLRHKESHLEKKSFICSNRNCKRKFSTVYQLASHEKLHDRPNIVVCPVPECSVQFQKKKYLDEHMKTHDECLPSYVCNYESCGKRYYTNNALMSHQRCHSYSDSDITCSWPGCGKTFPRPSELKTHMRFHTGQKPYACTFKGCKWAFSTASKLIRHQKKHTNERKFVCDIGDCGKSYLRRDHLRSHMLTHTEERRFHCGYCDNAFALKNQLYAHIKKHSNKNFVSKGHYKVKKNKTVEKKNTSKKKETYCSRVQPVKLSASRLKKTALTDYDTGNDQSTTNRKGGTLIPPNLSSPVMEGKENTEDMYFCPIDTCTKWYPLKSSLRMHLRRKHKRPFSEIQNHIETRMTSSGLLPYHTMNDSPQNFVTNGLPSPMATEEDKQPFGGNKGSARTAFTRQDISSLKPERNVVQSSVAVDNVFSEVVNFGDSLLLTDELPSMCFQEDIDISEYETLLPDVLPTVKEISMSGLD